MSKTVYLKLRQLTKTNKADVYLSDIADVYADKKILARIKSIKVACFYKVKKDRTCINVMQVISCINQLDDTLEINNIGESDAVIEYKKNDQPAWMNIVMTVIVCIIIFIGSAYAIMMLIQPKYLKRYTVCQVRDIFQSIMCWRYRMP